jgi:hypothetical protein
MRAARLASDDDPLERPGKRRAYSSDVLDVAEPPCYGLLDPGEPVSSSVS